MDYDFSTMHECPVIESSVILKSACFMERGGDWNNAVYSKDSTRSGISDVRESVLQG